MNGVDWVNIYMATLLVLVFVAFLWFLARSKNLGPATYSQQEQANELLEHGIHAVSKGMSEQLKTNDLLQKILKELQKAREWPPNQN